MAGRDKHHSHDLKDLLQEVKRRFYVSTLIASTVVRTLNRIDEVTGNVCMAALLFADRLDLSRVISSLPDKRGVVNKG